jgi:hypothetical protein
MMNTDYLIVGAGAAGMIFADQLLTETDARIVIADRGAKPGGHWNEAYPFVRLHQPAAFYGAGSRDLGTPRLETAGFNRGLYELASGGEVASYFDALMRERFLPSGRVTYLPMTDHLGGGELVNRLSGHRRSVGYRRIVDATYTQTSIPATRPPPYRVAPGVSLVSPNFLPRTAPTASHFTVVGGGKTAMDVALWLLEMGAEANAIRWIVPRDSWLINRATVQPGDAFFARRMEAQAETLECAAQAVSAADLFQRLEGAGLLLRIDRDVTPTMFRGATIAAAEVQALGRINDVVRLGRVRGLQPDRIVLEQGEVAADPASLYIDCSASAFGPAPAIPVFNGDRITLQMIRANLTSFSFAAIAHVEAAYGDDASRNALCPPIPPANSDLDWLRLTVADLEIAGRWSSDRELRRWAGGHRLAGFGGWDKESHQASAIIGRMQAARPLALSNLQALLARSADPAPQARQAA